MIVRMPEEQSGTVRQHGGVLDEWVSLADIYPTILDMAGVELPERPVHGTSLVPLLENEETTWRDAVFVEFGGVNHLSTTMVSVRKGNMKYGWNCSGSDELHDLSIDPYEMENAIEEEEYSMRLSQMRQLLADWMLQTGHLAIGMYEFSRLRSLGPMGT